ncbi:class I SAM-dependent methyltransferase, partial [Helicobacter bilis]|uniref:class I SAM-dependent methyltransferase n=1 Tax=Helicobacter bilis TaxID=37372 RepID=UPI001B3364D3
KYLGGGGVATSLVNDVKFIRSLLLRQNADNLNVLFDVVYETNMWGNGSGSGSCEKLCKNYVVFLQDFFKKYNITSIVDAGCGDWQFSKNIDFSGIKYHGYDVASQVIKNNTSKYSKDNVVFHLYDGDFSKLPAADLLLCKDVLQHPTNAKIQSFIDNLYKFKYALITNDIGEHCNYDILTTECRNLDLRLAPFFLDCKIVFEIQENHPQEWGIASKPTMLWVNPNSC